MRRTILLSGACSFLMAFLGGALAFTLMAAPPATAQSSQPQEVRASAFTLVGADGTVLARLAPGGGAANGRLALYDAGGTERLRAAGAGTLNVFDPDGTLVFRAGRSFEVGVESGLPAVNGVELGPGGSISVIRP